MRDLRHLVHALGIDQPESEGERFSVCRRDDRLYLAETVVVNVAQSLENVNGV